MIDREDLHSYLDGELSAAEEHEVKEILDKDPSSVAEFHSMQRVKDLLRTRTEPVEYEALWKSCQERLDEVDKSKRVESFVGRYSWGICALFFMVIAVGGYFNRVNGKSVRPNEIAGYVAGVTAIPLSPTESQEKLDPRVKDAVGEALRSKPEQMRLLSVSRSDVPGHRVGYVQLGDSFGVVTVMVMPDVQRVEGGWQFEGDERFMCGKVDGMNALFWKDEKGVICLIMGQRSYGELRTMVESMQATR